MIDAVFDTNILLQAALSDSGPACACWDFVEAGSVRLWATQSTLAELEDVLTRPKVNRRFTSAQRDRVESLLIAFRKHILVVAPPEVHFHLERDADDEIFVNLAIVLKAEYLVSRDRDLLNLREDSAFSFQFPNLQIVTPVGFLEIVRAK